MLNFILGFIAGDVLVSVAFLIVFCYKTKRFFNICEKSELLDEKDVRAHYEYGVRVAPAYDYYLWSNCPIRNQYKSEHDCEIWNCPARQQGCDLKCKGLKHSSDYAIERKNSLE